MVPIVALLAIALQQQGNPIPDTVPGRRLTEFLAAFNTKDSQKIGAMVSSTFAKSALKLLPAEEWTTRISSATGMAPVSVDQVLKSTEGTIIVTLKANAKFPVGLRLDLEPEVPYGIINAVMASPEEVMGTKNPKKYARWKTLEELTVQIRKDYKLPGLCVAYEVLGQKPEIYVDGVKSTRANAQIEPDDRFLVGSIGKAMTAMVIATLVDQHKLSWRTTLGSALPNIKMSDDYKNVTIDQLFHHQSGLPQSLSLSQTEIDQLAAKVDTATDLRKAFVANVLSHAPTVQAKGYNADYAPDYIVAAYLAERVIGQSYEWMVQRYVFDPIRMNTGMIAPVGSDGQVGSGRNVYGHVISDLGYVPYLVPINARDMLMAPTGAGISCSIGDLIKFGEFNLKGLEGDAQVLTAASYKYIHGPLSEDNKDQDICGWSINPPMAGEKCFAVSTTDGTFSAEFTLWPDSNLIAIAMTNAGTNRSPTPTLQAVLAIRDRVEKKE